MQIVTPIVHLNGTSKDELLALRENVYSALDSTLAALRQMGPNGRDYYPEPGRMQRAEDQHRRRCQLLTDLMEEIEQECGMIEMGK